ncbi:hypothetical protein SFRURICE_020987 [Spodoptera frugiperda]|nr:hypothetical protein SFRURICE_020987 [Spodoptera frugiperda]
MTANLPIGSLLERAVKVSVHRPVSHATHFSLSCIETHTTASTDPHRTDRIIGNTYMRCVLTTSYGMRTMHAMRACGSVPSVRVCFTFKVIETRVRSVLLLTGSNKPSISRFNSFKQIHTTASTDPHRTDRIIDDVIRNADAKNPSESGIGNPIAETRVGNPNPVDTVDAV